MYSIAFETYDTLAVARCQGEFTYDTALALREELERVVKAMKVKDMALDLAAVTKIDSTGLGALVGVSTKARSWGKRLMLFRAPHMVYELLDKVQIRGFFPILEDENDVKARQLFKHV